MKTINYTGSSKIINRIVHLLNRKAPLPLNGDGDAVWGTNGQVLTTDGQGNTSWTTPQGGGGDVTDVEVNGTSVVNAQGVAEVSVPTNTSDLNNDSGFIDGTDLSTALSDYTPTVNLATVATSGDYDDLTNKPTIPAAQVNSDWNAVSGVAEILNKPTIPTVGDGTITIQKNGTTVDTFTTNQSANKTVNITVTEGHTIWNRIKTALTSRVALWFADASVSDVSADGATKVEVVTELQSESDFDNLATDGTADGAYCFPDSGEEYLTADNVGYGSGAVEDTLDELTLYDTAELTSGAGVNISVQFVRKGNLVAMRLKDGRYTAAAGATLFTIPAAFRPALYLDFIDTYSSKRIQSDANGNVLTVSSVSDSPLRGSISYIAQ